MSAANWPERWTRVHALLLAPAALVCAPLRLVWPAALLGTASLTWMLLVELREGREAPPPGAGAAPVGGRAPIALGAANAVTLGRLVLVLVLALRLEAGAGPIESGLMLLVFALDGVDGWIARRGGTASELGARFDMEADALFTLVCALGLYACGRLAAFVLVPGVLRYAYVLVLALVPRLRREAPRSRLGRWAFALMIVSFAVSAWPLYQHAWLALLASAGIVLSFARSVYWSLRNV